MKTNAPLLHKEPYASLKERKRKMLQTPKLEKKKNMPQKLMPNSWKRLMARILRPRGEIILSSKLLINLRITLYKEIIITTLMVPLAHHHRGLSIWPLHPRLLGHRSLKGNVPWMLFLKKLKGESTNDSCRVLP